ncbi:MAG: hypothetical protein KY452_04445 [Actinobacteria bacterium]|nr:hypothetical protein [Actinomycetota bacterium]
MLRTKSWAASPDQWCVGLLSGRGMISRSFDLTLGVDNHVERLSGRATATWFAGNTERC